MVNDQGGINAEGDLRQLRRRLQPPRTVEMARKLVEQDQVLFLFQTLGTPSNTAITSTMTCAGCRSCTWRPARPSGTTRRTSRGPWAGSRITRPKRRIYARHILKTRPDAKIAVLYQNDDYGKDYLKGLKDGLGGKAQSMIVAEASYEVSDPTVDSQIVQLQSSGANVFFNITTPKFAAQAIRKAYDIGWKPVHYLNNVSTSVGSVLTPAGLDKAAGDLDAYYKDPTDAHWANDRR